MTSEQEQKDLDELKFKIQQAKVKCFDYVSDVVHRYTPIDLLHSGYRDMTPAQAAERIIRSYQKDINKLTKDHVKKYPDEK